MPATAEKWWNGDTTAVVTGGNFAFKESTKFMCKPVLIQKKSLTVKMHVCSKQGHWL